MRGEIRVGTSSWTDPTLIESGWYPPEAAKNAEARLRFYAARFNLVEVDSTYYGLPSEDNARRWAERTPDGFVFNVKAYALMTQHPAEVRALPPEIRHGFSGKRVYAKDVPEKVIDLIFERFASALEPLRAAGKLGALLFQFPQWFTPSRDARAYVEHCRDLLPGFLIAVEFRNRTWLEEPERTLSWLEDAGLAFVCVDAPPGFASSMPPVAAATHPELAFVRFHGRNTTTWEKKGLTAAERFDYRYSEDELREWVPTVESLAEQARTTHVLFNNCFRDHGVVNARQMAGLLNAAVEATDEPQAPLFDG